MELGQWVIWVIFHVQVTGSSFWPDVRPEFFQFSKKCPKCKTYIWNADMTKVIVRCLLLDGNHWMSVHAMNFSFYLWLLWILWPENTSSHISRHLEFIIEQGPVGRWIPGSLGRWVTKCDTVPSLLRGRQMQVWWVKIGDFRQITGYISKTVQFLFKSNRKSYALYRIVALPMTLNAL